MSATNPTVTVGQMVLTPMQVLFQPAGDVAFMDLGGTLDNVVVSAKYTKAEIKADQLGTTVLDRAVSGIEITVTTSLTEIRNKEFMNIVYPAATLGGTGVSDAAYLQFNSQVGNRDQDVAGILKLHPISVAATDESQDLYFWKATSSEESEITWGPEEQSKAKLVWNILPDLSVSPPRFFRYGDKDL